MKTELNLRQQLMQSVEEVGLYGLGVAAHLDPKYDIGEQAQLSPNVELISTNLKAMTKEELYSLRSDLLKKADEAYAVMTFSSAGHTQKRYKIAERKLHDFDLAVDMVNEILAEKAWESSPMKKSIDWTKGIIKKGKERWQS